MLILGRGGAGYYTSDISILIPSTYIVDMTTTILNIYYCFPIKSYHSVMHDMHIYNIITPYHWLLTHIFTVILVHRWYCVFNLTKNPKPITVVSV